MNKLLLIIRNVITIVTTLIFSIMISLVCISTENIILILISLTFGFVLLGTTLIDIFKKRKFSKTYTIITSILMIIVLITMVRPILDTLYISGLGGCGFDYIINNCLILFFQNMYTYIIIFILMFIGNYIDYKM